MKISLYIHIPFCVKKCLYCDFLSGPYDDEVRISYINALCNELKSKSTEYKDCKVISVYIGGGTPSSISSKYIEQIMSIVFKYYELDADAEISIEVNPGTVENRDKLLNYYRSGINRLSIGLQSTDNHLLHTLGRIHTLSDFEKIYDESVSSGFDNISVDLISGIPGQTIDGFTKSLEYVSSLGSELKHISVYSLIIEEGTRFNDLYGENGSLKADLIDEDTDRKIYHLTKDILSSKGYYRYEISNYSKSGYESRHNTRYWERGDYIGFGIGSASLYKNIRWNNPVDINDYIKNNGLVSCVDKEILSKENQMEEFMYLGLRMTRGISILDFEKEFEISFPSEYKKIVNKYVKSGHMKMLDDRVMLTELGLDVSNYIMAEFIF